MKRAVILGGTGLIGQAAARALLASGWRVDVTGRSAAHFPTDLAAAGARFDALDRSDPTGLRRAVGAGADLLVDCLCFTAADAKTLLPLLSDVTSAAVISSKAVYVDGAGRHVNSAVPPRFTAAISESQPTMGPSDEPYDSPNGYGANKVAAEQVLLDSAHPVSILRPSKVHGRGALPPREWVFIKRALDRRPAVLLAHGGVGVDHPTAAVNIAALIQVVAANPGSRVLNIADPDTPSGLDISRAIAQHLDHVWREVLLDDTADPELGRHPWDARPPIVLDMTAADRLGYRPVGNYARTVPDEIDWLVNLVGDRGELPDSIDRAFFAGMFDYAAEDRYLAELDR